MHIYYYYTLWTHLLIKMFILFQLVDSADVATANFMAEQQQRTIELEKKLDMHIQGLKVATEATVRKYTGR